VTEPEIKVTKIKDRWHARLHFNDSVFDEMACECSEDIGLICKEMLRWFSKSGGNNEYADKARCRQSTIRPAVGKIWYKVKLDEEKTTNNK
jgi:hypothetical protein